MEAEPVTGRARALVGTRFRPQGRDAGHGLDCIGLVVAALAAEGVRRDYPLRSGDLPTLERELEASGLERGDAWQAGDVLVMRPAPAQLHLGIWTGSSLVHADAALRRVVERPGAPPWTVMGCWRRRQ